MQKSIEQMNMALADFEGRKFSGHTIDKFGGNTGNTLPEMKYHTSFDWLMNCWKKANDTMHKLNTYISDKEFEVEKEIIKSFNNACKDADVKQAHEAVYNGLPF